MQLGELAGDRRKAIALQHLTSSPPPVLSLLPPAIWEVHPQEDGLIPVQVFSCGNYQQVAEPGGPGCLQLGCLRKTGSEKPRVTGAQGDPAPPTPARHTTGPGTSPPLLRYQIRSYNLTIPHFRISWAHKTFKKIFFLKSICMEKGGKWA